MPRKTQSIKGFPIVTKKYAYIDDPSKHIAKPVNPVLLGIGSLTKYAKHVLGIRTNSYNIKQT